MLWSSGAVEERLDLWEAHLKDPIVPLAKSLHQRCCCKPLRQRMATGFTRAKPNAMPLYVVMVSSSIASAMILEQCGKGTFWEGVWLCLDPWDVVYVCTSSSYWSDPVKYGPCSERFFFFFFIMWKPVALTQAMPSEPFVCAEALKACALIGPHLLSAEEEVGSSGCQSLDVERHVRYGCPKKRCLGQWRWAMDGKRRHFFIWAVRTQRGKFCSVWYGARPVRSRDSSLPGRLGTCEVALRCHLVLCLSLTAGGLWQWRRVICESNWTAGEVLLSWRRHVGCVSNPGKSKWMKEKEQRRRTVLFTCTSLKKMMLDGQRKETRRQDDRLSWVWTERVEECSHTKWNAEVAAALGLPQELQRTSNNWEIKGGFEVRPRGGHHRRAETGSCRIGNRQVRSNEMRSWRMVKILSLLMCTPHTWFFHAHLYVSHMFLAQDESVAHSTKVISIHVIPIPLSFTSVLPIGLRTDYDPHDFNDVEGYTFNLPQFKRDVHQRSWWERRGSLLDPEMDDEHLRNILASPLYLQEREACADLSHVYHSDEENSMSRSQQVSAGAEKPVAMFSQKRKSSQELIYGRTRIPLEEQGDNLLSEARSEILKRECRKEFAEKNIRELNIQVESHAMECGHALTGYEQCPDENKTHLTKNWQNDKEHIEKFVSEGFIKCKSWREFKNFKSMSFREEDWSKT